MNGPVQHSLKEIVLEFHFMYCLYTKYGRSHTDHEKTVTIGGENVTMVVLCIWLCMYIDVWLRLFDFTMCYCYCFLSSVVSEFVWFALFKLFLSSFSNIFLWLVQYQGAASAHVCCTNKHNLYSKVPIFLWVVMCNNFGMKDKESPVYFLHCRRDISLVILKILLLNNKFCSSYETGPMSLL